MNNTQMVASSGIDLTQYVIGALAAVLVITLHGFTMALVSHKMGDPLPKKNKLVSFNPIKHIEPVGLILMVIFNGYGWGKPMDTAAVYYKERKRGILLTNLIPIAVNLLMGLLIYFICKQYYRFITVSSGISALHVYGYRFLFMFAYYSVRMAVFNLIPIYPLDGAKVLTCFLSPNDVVKKSSYERVLLFVLVIMLLWGIAQRILDPICNLFFMLVP